MNPLHVQKDNRILYLQRNILMVIAGIGLLANLLLSICLLSKKEKIILIPGQLNQEAVLGDVFSISYMEEVTNFFVGLLLDLTPSNVEYKSSIVLKHVDSSSYNTLKKYFDDEEEKHKKYNLCTSFAVTNLTVKGLRVEISGILTSRFGDSGKQEQSMTYLIQYKNSHGRLLLTKFETIQT